MTLQEEGVLICPAGMKAVAGTLVPPWPLEKPDWTGVRDMHTAIVAVGLALKMDPIELGKVIGVFRHLIARQRGNGRLLWRDVFEFVGLDAPAA
jgi:hypothetical protein